VVPDGFSGGGSVEPGTFQWDSAAFDITPAQAGGTLLYKDGGGRVTRWALPKTTTGPEAERSRSHSNNGAAKGRCGLVDTNGEAGRARALAEADLREGPPALEPGTVETKRYGLTDALDDLADTGDRIERLAVAGYVLNAAADLLCDFHHAWSGGGKWLPRRLLESDAQHGAALLEGPLYMCESGDPALMIDAASEILDLVSGPLREGYRRTWRGVIESVATAIER
jgi:hypothetical protein